MPFCRAWLEKFDYLIDESVGDTEEFLDVLVMIIVDCKTVVFEVVLSFGVLHAGHIQDVGDAQTQQFLDVEGGLNRADIDSWRYLMLRQLTKVALNFGFVSTS